MESKETIYDTIDERKIEWPYLYFGLKPLYKISRSCKLTKSIISEMISQTGSRLLRQAVLQVGLVALMVMMTMSADLT